MFVFPLRKATLTVIAICACSVFAPAEENDLIGKQVDGFSLRDVISNKPVKLQNHRGKVVVLVWYSPNCSACPEYNVRLKELSKAYRRKGVELLGICSSSIDVEADLKSYAQSEKLDFPLLIDESAAVAQQFGVQQTCTFVVIDGKGILRYWGGFDDSTNATNVKVHCVRDAVDSVLTGKVPERQESSPLG